MSQVYAYKHGISKVYLDGYQRNLSREGQEHVQASAVNKPPESK